MHSYHWAGEGSKYWRPQGGVGGQDIKGWEEVLVESVKFTVLTAYRYGVKPEQCPPPRTKGAYTEFG